MVTKCKDLESTINPRLNRGPQLATMEGHNLGAFLPYICETGRSIKTRPYEYQRFVKTDLLTHSAVTEHQRNMGQ